MAWPRIRDFKTPMEGINGLTVESEKGFGRRLSLERVAGMRWAKRDTVGLQTLRELDMCPKLGESHGLLINSCA